MSLILLADDDDILVEIIRMQLESEGHELVVAENGEEALQCLERCKPDLVILDAIMPVLGGEAVLSEIRTRPVTRDTPVLMLTGCKDREDFLTASGANEYMTKPFRPDELSRRVTDLLRSLHRTDQSH